MDEIKIAIYKHFKGKFIQVICLAKHSDRDETLVVYRGLNDGGHFARPTTSFTETVTNANGESVKRFTLATDKEIESLKTNGLI